MKTSVVVRTLNEEESIVKCLDALHKQSLMPNEILVIDNGSTDKTIELVKAFKSKKIKLLNCKKRGYTPGLNLGADRAKGEYIIYLSADCIPETDWLLTLVTTQQKTHASVIQGCEVIPSTNPVKDLFVKETYKEDAQINFFNNTNTLYVARHLKPYLPFFEPYGVGGEDTIMSLRYAKDGKTAYFASRARAKHKKFKNIKEFEKHMYDHGMLSRWFFFNYFTHPRLYLNSFYWAFREFGYGMAHRDIKVIRIGISRFFYNALGFLGIPLRKADS